MQAFITVQARITSRSGALLKTTSFVKKATTTIQHNINESEKASYVNHINRFLSEDKFLKDFLPMDPKSNQLFELVKDGVLLW